jgi:elongation factor P
MGVSTAVHQLRKKNVVRYNGENCLVVDAQLRTPPNNAAFFQMELRNIGTGKAFPVRCGSKELFEVMENQFRQLDFSYENQGTYVFMDPVTFDQIEIPRERLESVMDFLVPEQRYEILFVEGEPLTVDLPSNIVMKVTEAAEATRGNTSGNATKLVTLETGLRITVPMFVKNGDMVKVSPEKEYLGRA